VLDSFSHLLGVVVGKAVSVLEEALVAPVGGKCEPAIIDSSRLVVLSNTFHVENSIGDETL
jgi:hypothetical protein